jgi:hypothetical protein
MESPAWRQGLELGGVVARTVAHFWPDMRAWLDGLRDPRDPNRIAYPARCLTWTGLLVFLLKLGSRRQIRFELDSPVALENLNRLAGCRQDRVPHGDTLNYFVRRLVPDQLHGLRRRMVNRLIRMKALDGGRLRGHFPVVIDGTGQRYFRRRHCPHCLERTVGGQTQYFHHVLEAKLVTPEGLAISIGTEFIENADPKATKEDCEKKAFARLAPRLHSDFPQLRLCLLLDALYANGPVFDLCSRYHWKYIITFKEGGLPALWTEYEALRDLQPENRRTETPAKGVRQTFAWVSDLPYTDTEGRSFHLGALQCQEEGPKGDGFFAWLTNFPVEPNTVTTLANRGGRLRWKIENEGFNIQKNGGFDLEHAYGTGPWAIKNFYLLMQLAHLVLQLVERGNLLVDRCETLFGSLRALARRLAESLRNHLIDAQTLDTAAAARIQIRLRALDTS